MFVFFCRPADGLLSPQPGGGQGNLATLAVAQDCMFCLIFFLMHVILFSLCYAFSARHFPRLAGLWVVPPFHFELVFAFLSRPPATMVACGRVLTLVFLVLAPVLSFNSPFLRLAPPATPTIRGRVLTVVGLAIAPF